ncbi:MAG: DUF4296 domain-containing protein [Prevotellaceae bacterium]|nr:DUF4296 domain-containing protein [Prevotellaceae bacterium]
MHRKKKYEHLIFIAIFHSLFQPIFRLILLLGVALVAGCSSDTVSQRTLVKVLAEIHLADAVMDERHGAWERDSTGVYLAIFDKYGCTPKQLENTLAKYCTTKDDATNLYSKVSNRLEKLQQSYADELRKLDEADSLVRQLHMDSVRLIEMSLSEISAAPMLDTLRLRYPFPLPAPDTFSLAQPDSTAFHRLPFILFQPQKFSLLQ